MILMTYTRPLSLLHNDEMDGRMIGISVRLMDGAANGWMGRWWGPFSRGNGFIFSRSLVAAGLMPRGWP